MALPPDKKIPGTDQIGKAAGDLADNAAQKASDLGSSAADAAKSALPGAATTGGATAGSVTQTTAGNRGVGGRPAVAGQSTVTGANTPPPLPTQGTAQASSSSVPSSNARPSTTNTARPSAPSTARPSTPSTDRPNTPSTTRPNTPSTARPSAPSTARPNTASTARPNTPSTARPNTPSTARPSQLERPASSEAPRRPVSQRPQQRPQQSASRPAPRGGRPAPRDARPRKPMAPPPGARNGRYAAPARRPSKRGYVVPPAAADTGGHAWFPLLLGILLLGGVLWYAIKHYTPMISADLTTRTNGALADAGYGDGASVEIDGRTAILTGNVDTQPDSDRAEEAVADTIGVRTVDNQLVIDGSAVAEVERTQPSVAFAASDTGIVLSGTVSDQDYADEIKTAAVDMYGEDGVSGEITVDPNSTNPGWWPAVKQLTPDLKALDGGAFSVADGALVLSGVASDETVKSDLGTKATDLVKGQLNVDNQITVAKPAPVALEPGFATIYNSAERIALYGSLPAASVAEIEGSLSGASKPVESFIVASDAHDAPAWIANFGGSLDAMQDINKGKVKIQPSGEIQLSGIATSDEAKQVAEDNVSALFPDQEISNRIAVRVPAPEPEPAPEPAPVAPFMKPFVTLTDTGSEVQMDGLLPSGASESIQQAIEATGRTVVANVTVDERVMDPSWTQAITQSFDSLGGIENAKASISSSGELTLSGIAASNDDRQQAESDSFVAFNNSVSLRNDIEAKGPDINELLAQIDLAAIRFRSNSSELDSDSIGILDQVANALSQSPDTYVAIGGHTDRTGSDRRNQELSAERAEKVKNFLIDRGISSDRMTSQGYGSSQPIADNNTVTGRALNRRIEFGLN